MFKKASVILQGLIILLFTGCAGMQPGYETPSVIITDFRALPSDEIAPRFQIVLHIINPNRTPLELKGLAYTVTLEGHKILTGVSNKLPVIDPYGEGDVTLVATTDLFSGISLFVDLMKQQKDTFSYLLDVKMDPGGFSRNIHVKKEGDISLAPSR